MNKNYIKNWYPLLAFYLLIGLFFQLKAQKVVPIPSTKPTIHSIIEQVRKKYAPDKRVAIFQVDLDSNRIVGQTNLPLAKKELINRLKSNSYALIDRLQLLPNVKELDEKIFALVNVSVANIRSQPKEWAELASQTLLGTPLKVLDKEKYWFLVQTPDNYIGWVEGTTITRLTKEQFEQSQTKDYLMYAKPYGFAYQEPNSDSQTISDLTWGNLLAIQDTVEQFIEVQYPDARKAYILQNEVINYKNWKQTVEVSEQNLVKTATKMLGFPYLWGGTSWKGVDCSGFTRMIYQANGILLPRDASQQAYIGTEVSLDSLQIGDLLFFGEKATTEKSEKVSHVAMWIGNREFIHSSGMVKIGSFDKNASNYDNYNVARYLRSRRIIGTEKGVVSLKK